MWGERGGMTTRGANKRDVIVAAATELIRTRGVHETSIADIIGASGASAGTIYHHFAGKHDIILAVALTAVGGPLQAAIASTGDGPISPGDVFRVVARTVLGGQIESAVIVQLWAGSAAEPGLKEFLQREMAGARQAVIQRIDAWLEEHEVALPGHAERLAELTIGLVMGLLAERLIISDIDQDAYVRNAARMLDAAALAPEASSPTAG